MKLRRMRLSRLEHLSRLIDDFISPIIWVCDDSKEQGGYFRIQTLQEYLENIKYDFDGVVKGYIDVFTFTDAH